VASPGYQVDVWRADDGLPQGTVTSIEQTPDGYLWLGTQNGLVRFDGVRFQVFNENNTPAIKNNRIVQLFVDGQGTLWVGAEQGCLVSVRSGTFTAYDMPGLGTTFNYARGFCDDAEGRLYVLSCEWQLMRLTQGALSVLSTNWGLSGPHAIARDPAGRVYIGTDRELAAVGEKDFRVLWNRSNEEAFEVQFLATSRAGGCWVAGNGRLRRFDQGRWVADRGATTWSDSPIYGLCEDSHNRLWVATLGSGLFRYDPEGTVRHLTVKEGLPTDFVRCVKEDREENIWVGTEGGGLCRLKPALFETLGTSQGLSSDQALSVCEAADGSYWIGMNGSGLDHLTSRGVEHYGASQGLMNGHVWSVIEDTQGAIWAGTWGGLFRLDAGRFLNLSDGHTIGGVVLAMQQCRAGGLWLGQQATGMLSRIRGEERTAVSIPGASPSLDVRVMAEDTAGWLWVGTQEEGLYRWKDGQCSHFGKKEGLASQSIWSLRADADGSVWIGTCGGGLSWWHQGRLATWTTRDGLVNDVIAQILEDGHGNLWLGSYGGVFRVSKAELQRSAEAANGRTPVHCVGYGRDDGLPSIECQGGFQPSGLQARDGRLWFPTIKGLAVVDPDRVSTNLAAPVVLVEDLVVDGQAALPATNPKQAEPAVPPASTPLRIGPGKRNIEFHYTATSLTAPQKVQFKYRLEGLEKEWTDARGRRTATYSRLPPGDYVFHVLACNNDGVWNEQGATLSLAMLPYFWQTNWFVSTTGLALLAALFVTMRRLATRRLRLKLERLEREQMVERERARIAKDLHDELGACLTEITILSKLAQSPENPADKARKDVQDIAAKSQLLTQLLDEIVWAVNPRRDSLENFVSYTCSFAQDYLQVAKIHCRLDLPVTVSETALRTDLRHSLFLVVKEALNNVVKHAQATEVTIGMEMRASEFIVRIRDNGRGFQTDSPEPTHSDGEGLGSMRHRIESMDGEFLLTSQPGNGTQIEIRVPLKK
jgi:signal transduction histidine kinase/ligand-binding sensor domain-containing protein